ncbi:hypothetical protein [Solirubrobacter pauli]|nr:hypothetical protein [Solirubrobacter pauli]
MDDRRVIALATALAAGEQGDTRSVGAIHELVVRRLRGRMRLTRSEAEDAASETLRAFAEMAVNDEIELARSPALLTAIAQRKAVDLLRRRESHSPATLRPASEPSTEELVIALLERDADARVVRAAMRAAFAIDRGDIVYVVRIWLDLADAQSGVPSLREVAAEARISHTQVRRLLNEFKELVPHPPSGT